jgi:hypothetical protein
MRDGVVEQSLMDGDQKAQAIDWMLLDIFAPFRAEYEIGRPFGSLWNQWVDDLVSAALELRKTTLSTVVPIRANADDGATVDVP